MKQILLCKNRKFLSIRRIFPVFMLLLVGYGSLAQCPPIITPFPATTSICAGDSVTMVCTPSTGTTWQWYKDGDVLSGETNSTFYAFEGGSYTVMTGNCATPSNQVHVTIKPFPFLSIAYSALDICVGEEVTLTVSTGPNITWLWIAPASPSFLLFGTSLNPVVKTLTSTTMFQIMGADSITNCASTTAVTIVVNPLITPGTLQSDSEICAGETPPLMSSTPATGGNGEFTYQWQSSTTNSTTGFTNIEGATGLSYQPEAIFDTTWYRIAIISPPCPDNYTNTVIVQVNPNPVLNSAATKAICSGSNVGYNPGSTVAGATFTWSATVTSGIVSGVNASGNGIIDDVLSVPDASSEVGEVTYIITPTGPAPTFCPGTPFELKVSVYPIPLVTNPNLSQEMCAGTTSQTVVLQSNETQATFTWGAIATDGISGFEASGSGNIPPMEILSLLTVPGTVTYSITALGPSPAQCVGSISSYIITVNPSPSVTNNPLQQSICTGDTSSEVIITSNVPATFTWNATAEPPSISGFQESGTDIIPAQIITNPSNIQGVITYSILPSGSLNGCAAVPSDYQIFVNPLPIATATPTAPTICSGDTTSIVLTSTVDSSFFIWTASGSTELSGFSGGTGDIISQAIINNSNNPFDVVYTITPYFNGCAGSAISITVKVNPLPIVYAGADTTIFYGTSTALTGTATGGTGTLNYLWKPETNIGQGGNSLTPLTTNLYSECIFTLTATDLSGCSATDSTTVFIVGGPLTALPTVSPEYTCAGDTATIFANASGGSGNYTYSWSCFPEGDTVWTSNLENPVVFPNDTTTYIVTVDDGFNATTDSVTLIVNPLPTEYSVFGGGSYCKWGTGVEIGLNGSDTSFIYQLLRAGIADGPTVLGTGDTISFGNRTAAFVYKVSATNNITGCVNLMNDSAIITIIPLPTAFLVTGGGSYPAGGPGKKIGLAHGDSGVTYQLYCDNLPVGSPIAGTETEIDFGLQTTEGTYTVGATDQTTGCVADMSGSVDIVILAAPALFDVTGGGNICFGEPGLFIGLAGSEIGVDYQLLFNGFPEGGLVAGTDLPLSWGPFILEGLYEVNAINTTYGAMQMMDGSAVIVVNPLPTLFTVSPSGSQCPGTIVRLNGSDLGFSYYLLVNGICVDTAQGTGLAGFLEFGPQYINGTYTVRAKNSLTGCEDMMNGSVYIYKASDLFNITPAGILCPGQTIGLSGSQTGVKYQLRRNGTFDMGAPIPGTGSPINFLYTDLTGFYTVVAIDSITNCVTYMNDSTTIYPFPIAFTIMPDGVACENDVIGLNGSELGVDYVLLLDNAIHIDTISGTGFPIDFGPQTSEGNYTVVAINQYSYCEYPQNGQTHLNDGPIKYSVLPVGGHCVGTTIDLSGSQVGVSYQLLLDGTINMGLPVSGTGSLITFGAQTQSGVYTVRAVNDISGCYIIMNDSATLEAFPITFMVSPIGHKCAGTSITLGGSEINFNYILVLNGSIGIDTIAGTGNAISFGPQITSGSYSITAYNTLAPCFGVMDGVTIIETAPNIYTLNPQGIACQGTTITLDNSQTGINYQLRWNGNTNIGSPLLGTGSPLDFGTQNLAGNYTIIATGGDSCVATMNGNLEVSSFPTIFAVTPSGNNCENTVIGLNGSELDINYVLVLDGGIYIDTIAGTGDAFNFTAQITSGTYTIIAYHSVTHCQVPMAGTAVILAAPLTFTITSAGYVCQGTTIGLDNSEIGVSYQLRWNATTNVGLPVTGTGSPISFGSQTLTGIYTIIAVASNGCVSEMNGSIAIEPLPVVYTLSPLGANCSGTPIGLNGSETGINYVLVLDGGIFIDTITGNGNSISFGAQVTDGAYTSFAFNPITNCEIAMTGSSVIEANPLMYSLTPAGFTCQGTTIGLENSEIGVSYQLRWNGSTNIGSPVLGTGAAITFGTQTLLGNYTVIATSSNNCVAFMNNSIVIDPLPVAFTVTPTGTNCASRPIGLNGSELNVNYVLWLDGSIIIDTISGTGSAISFEVQSTAGVYTVSAYYPSTNCQMAMNGTSVIKGTPVAYNMTPAGYACPGTNIGLENSETGVEYQLRWNGSTNVGSPVAGTGAAISFGIQTLAGTYTVITTASNNCVATMNGNLVIAPFPVEFTVVPSGSNCANTPIGLNGSEIDINYVLVLDGIIYIDTVPGTGTAISFGPQITAGSYSVIAYHSVTQCQIEMNGFSVIYVAPETYNMTPAGIICSGATLGLDDSETGVTYQLLRDANYSMGVPVQGTGSAIDFGQYSIPGVYSAIATNGNNCSLPMNGNVVLNPLPTAFNIVPTGQHCQGITVSIDGSETGVSYILVLNGSIHIDTISGNGSAVSFGAQSTSGDYSVEAFTLDASCQISMNGTTSIHSAPLIFNITPAGVVCPGTVLGVNGSEVGVNYQLRRDGLFNVGSPVLGTGFPISFGIQTLSGTYTVEAVINASCSSIMAGEVLVHAAPTVFTQLPQGSFCPGTSIQLNGSENGVSYILYRDGIFPVDTIAGTGSTLSFGSPIVSGTYTISAISAASLCESTMNGITVIFVNPTIFNITPSGINCSGSIVGLDNSEQGISYQLIVDGITNVGSPVAGSGSAISFGIINVAGNYTVLATNNTNGCANTMNGISVLQPMPLVYSLTIQGMQCAGSSIALNGSQTGIDYILIRDNIFHIDTVSGTGFELDFGPQTANGYYMIEAVNGATFCQSFMTGTVQIMPLPSLYNMTPAGLNCGTASIGLDGSETGVSYTLYKNNIPSGITIPGNGNAISFGLQTFGNYTIEATNLISNCFLFMSDSVLISYPLSVEAGANIETCQNASILIADATASPNCTISWTSNGTGNWANPETINPTYIPSAGDIANGAVTLTMEVSNLGCGSLSDSKTVNFINQPMVNAGPDISICEGFTATITAATGSTFSSVNWETSGTGTFTNANMLSPTYFPSLADIANGSVTLTLNAIPFEPCTYTVYDQTVLTIRKKPVVSAGNDALICSSQPYLNNDASVSNSATLTWSTSGSGTFNNVNNLINSYFPSNADLVLGNVTLTLTSSDNVPCSDISDSKEISFYTAPVADAGPSTTICSTCSFISVGALATNSTSLHWSTSGSGIFDNNSVAVTTYTPSAADYGQGSIFLMLTANSNPPCNAVVDTMTLTFSDYPGVDFIFGPACENQPISFTIDFSNTNVGAINSCIWNFGDGNTSTLMNPTHSFSSLGQFHVTLTAIDTMGNASSVTHIVTVSQLPVSHFSFSLPNCSNQQVLFTNLSHTLYGYISEWIWNYGDGSGNDTVQFPDDPNVSHQFPGPGVFDVSLFITNSFGCKAMVTIPVDVIEAPIANYSFDNECAGLETSFKDASFANGPGNTVEYSWNFGDPASGPNNNSNLKDAIHVFSSPGTYNVRHIVRNFNNCSDTIVKAVLISEPVYVDFVHTFTCVDGNTNFSPDTSIIDAANVTDWLWDFGDGVTDFQQNTVHVYTAPGTYQVTLTITSLNGCIASKTHAVVVNPLPVALFTIPQMVCQSAVAQFDDVSNIYSGFITKWEWDFGDGYNQIRNFPENGDVHHNYSSFGSYIATLTITSSDSCQSTYSQTIVVEPAPVTNFEFLSSCQKSPVQFNDLTQTGGTGNPSSWNWNFGDSGSGANNTSILQNPIHIYNTIGVYQVSLTVTTSNGCSSTVTKSITIGDAPYVDFGYDKRCQNADIQFSPASGVNTSNVALWNWSFGDGTTSSEQNPQHSYSSAGNYNVSLTITNINGCTNTVSHGISILAAPIPNFSTSSPACSQQLVNFTNQSVAPAGYIMRWEYDFGDGNSTVINFPGNPNIQHTYNSYGLFTASLTVVTNDSCSATISRSVEILQSALANFDYDATCSGIAVQFTDLSQGNLLSWAWNFGDSGSGVNNTSTQQNPSHTFQIAGSYQVNLSVQNSNGCNDTVNLTMNISPKPNVDFSFNTSCAGDTVNFLSSTFVNVSNTSSFLWQFGDNTTSTIADPIHIYANPGTYNSTLTIIDQNGCTNSKSHQVQVTTAPFASFNSLAQSCSGTAILFNDNSTTQNGVISSWHWDFGDGSNTTVNAPNNPDVSHVFAASGIFTVKLSIYTSTGCEAYYISNITIYDASSAAFSFSGLCEGSLTSFTDLTQASSGNPTIAWNWNFGDLNSGVNNTSTLQNPQHLFSAAGTYNVILTVENSVGCFGTTNQTFAIDPKPSLDFQVIEACVGTPVLYSADSIVTNIAEVASYLWDFGDGTAVSTQAAPEHLYSSPGEYVVSLSITNLLGCSNSVLHTQTMHALPVAQFLSSGNCVANSMQFKDISYNPDGEAIVAWAWDFGVGTSISDTSTAQNPSFKYTLPGTYNVTLGITSESGCTAVKVMQVVVIPAPKAQFSYVAEPCHDGSVLFTDESIGTQSEITSWYWEFTPGNFSTLANPVHVFGSSDTCYNVKLVVANTNGCTDTLVKEVCIPSGLEVSLNYTQTCFGRTTWFTPSLIQPIGGEIAFYKWDFGDPASGINNASTQAYPQHKFTKPGTFVVSLLATDINNCNTTIYKTITVSPLPRADFSFKGGICDSLVSFKDITTGAKIVRWIWDFGDGETGTIDAPESPNIDHIYLYPGIYETTLITETDAGCGDTVTKTIRRTPCITSAFDVKDTLVCQKRKMHFKESSICQAPIASWQWFFGDNTTATYTSKQQFVEHTYTVAGNYKVTMVVATQMVGGMVTDTSSSNIVVNPAAKADYTWKDACIGNTSEFENLTQPNNTTVKNYKWNFGAQNPLSDTSTFRSPKFTFGTQGQYNVKLVVTNTLGCTDTIVKKVTIFDLPKADFYWNSSCENKPVLFVDNSDTTSSSIVKWNWIFSNKGEVLGASTTAKSSYVFGHAGIYDADLAITDRNGCSSSVTKQIAINSSPVASFDISDNYDNKQGQIMLNNLTTNGTNFAWDFGNGTTSSANSPIANFETEGHYKIELITWNGQNCADTSIMFYDLMFKGLYVPNAFSPGHFDQEVAVFKPKGINLLKYNIEIYDRSGNLLWNSSKLDGSGSPAQAWDGTFNGEVLKQGVYLWRISAQFRDGKYWEGDSVGNVEGIPQTKSGTITLIR